MASCMSASSAQTTPQLLALCSHVSPEMALAATSSDPWVLSVHSSRFSSSSYTLGLSTLWFTTASSPAASGHLSFAPSPACWCTPQLSWHGPPSLGDLSPRTTEIDQTCTPSSGFASYPQSQLPPGALLSSLDIPLALQTQHIPTGTPSGLSPWATHFTRDITVNLHPGVKSGHPLDPSGLPF